MGQRTKKKNRQQRRKNAVNQANNLDTVQISPPAKVDVTNRPKRDTISDVDFFGFPAKVFAADLKRTGWATAVILVILAVITLLTRSL